MEVKVDGLGDPAQGALWGEEVLPGEAGVTIIIILLGISDFYLES